MSEQSQILDTDSLLAPFGGDLPCGNVSEPPEALAEIERAFEQARESPPEATDAWQAVLDRGTRLFQNELKSLNVAAWMIEACTRTHGYAGLLEGLRFYKALAERYWSEAHPAGDVETDGDYYRVRSLAALDGGGRGTFHDCVRRVPFARSSTGEISVHDVRLAAEMASDPALVERLSGKSIDVCKAVIGETTPEQLHEQRRLVEACMEELGELSRCLDEVCRPDSDGEQTSPSLGTLRRTLGEVRDEIASHYDESMFEAGPEILDEESAPAGPGASPASGGAGGPLNRAEAFRRLEEIARFFEQTEPHSPVPYAIRRAIRWGHTPLKDLLQELIRDSSNRDDLFRVMGIQVPEEHNE